MTITLSTIIISIVIPLLINLIYWFLLGEFRPKIKYFIKSFFITFLLNIVLLTVIDSYEYKNIETENIIVNDIWK